MIRFLNNLYQTFSFKLLSVLGNINIIALCIIQDEGNIKGSPFVFVFFLFYMFLWWFICLPALLVLICTGIIEYINKKEKFAEQKHNFIFFLFILGLLGVIYLFVRMIFNDGEIW